MNEGPGIPFQLFLFTCELQLIQRAAEAGVHGFIVDLEFQGKQARQSQYDTQINQNTLLDLQQVRSSTKCPVICRINGFGSTTAQEIEEVIAAGADEIFLPMVRRPAEVAGALDLVRDRCGLAILVETMEAVGFARQLGQFPLTRVYIGLNDLAIDRGQKNIFTSISDGTIDQIRKYFKVPFGFGGLTLPEAGFPIPCRLLMAEMARLDCSFSFLRRSFHRDILGKDMQHEVPRMLQSLEKAYHRLPGEIQNDHQDFNRAVKQWSEGSWHGKS